MNESRNVKPKVADQPCERFVQNAWRRELCANCMKPRASHHGPTPARRGKGTEVTSVTTVSKVSSSLTSVSKGRSSTASITKEKIHTRETSTADKTPPRSKNAMSASISDDILKLYDQAASSLEGEKIFQDSSDTEPDLTAKGGKFSVSKTGSKPPTASVKPMCRSQEILSTDFNDDVFEVSSKEIKSENNTDSNKPNKATVGGGTVKIPLTGGVRRLNGGASSEVGQPETATASPNTQRKRSFLHNLLGSKGDSPTSSPKAEKKHSRKKSKDRKGSKDSGNGSGYEPVSVTNESDTSSIGADVNKSHESIATSSLTDSVSVRSADDLDSDLGDGNFSRQNTGRKSAFESRLSVLSRIDFRRSKKDKDGVSIGSSDDSKSKDDKDHTGAASPAPNKKKYRSEENILDVDFSDKDKKTKKGKSFFKRLFGKDQQGDENSDQVTDDTDDKSDEKKRKKHGSKDGSPAPDASAGEKHENETTEKVAAAKFKFIDAEENKEQPSSMSLTADLKELLASKSLSGDRKSDTPLDNKFAESGVTTTLSTFSGIAGSDKKAVTLEKSESVKSEKSKLRVDTSQKPVISQKPKIGRPRIGPPCLPPVSPKETDTRAISPLSSVSSGSSTNVTPKHGIGKAPMAAGDDLISAPINLKDTKSSKPQIISPKPSLTKPKSDTGLSGLGDRQSIISAGIRTDSSEEELGLMTTSLTASSGTADSDSQKSPSHDGWKQRPKTDANTKAGKVVRRMSAAPPPPPPDGSKRRSTIEPPVTMASGTINRAMQGIAHSQLAHRLPGDFATVGRAGRVSRTTSIDVTGHHTTVKFARQSSDSNGLKASLDDDACYRKYKDPTHARHARNRTLTEGIKLDLNGLESNKPSKFIDRALPAPPKQSLDLNESLAENPYEMVSPDRDKPSTPYEDLDESLYQDLPDNGHTGPIGVSPNSDYLEPLTGGEVVNKRDSRADLPPPPPPPANQGGAKPKTTNNQGASVIGKPQDDWRPRVLPRRRPSTRQAARPVAGETELSIYANCDAITEREKPALGLQEGFRKIAIMNMECVQHLQSSLASEYVTESPKQKDNLKWKDFNVYTKEPLYNNNGVVLYSAQSKSDFRDCVVMVSHKPIGTDIVQFKHLNVLNPAVVFYDKISSDVFPDSNSKADPHPYQLYGMVQTQVVILNCSRITSLSDHMLSLSNLLTQDNEKYERVVCHILSQVLNGMLYLIEKGFQIRTLTMKDILTVTPIGKKETFIALNSVIYYRTIRHDGKSTCSAIVKLLFDLLQIKVTADDKTAYRSIPVRSQYSLGFQKMVKTLQGHDKQSILSARHILEIMVWGPQQDEIKALTLAEDREQAFDVWLELERCKLVNKYATEDPESSLQELLYMNFLCSSTGATLFETTKILHV